MHVTARTQEKHATKQKYEETLELHAPFLSFQHHHLTSSHHRHIKAEFANLTALITALNMQWGTSAGTLSI